MKGLAIGVLAVVILLVSTPARAQSGEFMLRGFADIGSTTFKAERSFDAILGDNRGPVWGGGIGVVLPVPIFVDVRASRFTRTGERMFVHQGQQFDLGIPVTVTLTPVTLIGGYRLDLGWRLVPYAGAGIGWHRYQETSEFAEESENVDRRFRGYHLLGGAEVRITPWLGTAFEAEWATVPDALGVNADSVSSEFNETDLGGTTLRVKVVIGR